MADISLQEIEDHLGYLAMAANDEDFGIHSATGNLCRSSIEIIRQLLNAQKWREIELWPEGLESVHIAHLVRCPEIRCTFTATRRDGEFKSFGGNGNIHHEVSHYAPLPSPPQEKENGE